VRLEGGLLPDCATAVLGIIAEWVSYVQNFLPRHGTEGYLATRDAPLTFVAMFSGRLM
jgi:hypothetical protein